MLGVDITRLNRNIVECKFVETVGNWGKLLRLNRNIVECKLYKHYAREEI